jgi:hypothetical protein
MLHVTIEKTKKVKKFHGTHIEINNAIRTGIPQMNEFIKFIGDEKDITIVVIGGGPSKIFHYVKVKGSKIIVKPWEP